MNPPGGIAAILLAAGAARRYGSSKQLLDIDGIPMVRHAANAILATGIELTVITGADAQRVSAALTGLPANLLHNPDWLEGMGGSIALAFRELLLRATPPAASLLCLADQPQVGATQLRQLIERHRRDPLSIVVAGYGEVNGPPCLFPSSYYAELSALHGDRGARPLLQRHATWVVSVKMHEARLDIDTPEDYQTQITTQRP